MRTRVRPPRRRRGRRVLLRPRLRITPAPNSPSFQHRNGGLFHVRERINSSQFRQQRTFGIDQPRQVPSVTNQPAAKPFTVQPLSSAKRGYLSVAAESAAAAAACSRSPLQELVKTRRFLRFLHKRVASRISRLYYVPMFTNYYIGVRIIADRIGVDPWDVDMKWLRTFTTKREQKPVSRFWFGSPCRFVRSIDLAVHVWLPEAITEKYPELATYLRSTSPRWGRSWRDW